MSIGLRGKIKSVAVKDFVTYNETIFFPGENLNVIIGPNGTGKSTLVSAIVLGMGGNCKLLSRSSSISDYVKNGKEAAQIEINIYTNDEGDLQTFNRSFDVHESDVFFVDGRKINHKNFLLEVKKFKIQVENLCQFLPQDRVQDFAKMNPQQILANTQSSVCEPEMAERLTKLVELRAKQKQMDKGNSEIIEQLREQEKRNEVIKPQLENMRLRNVYLEDIEDGNRKRAWLEVDDCVKQVEEVKNDILKAETVIEEHKKKLLPIQNKAEEIKKFQQVIQAKIQKAEMKVLSSQEAISKQEELFEKFKSDIRKNRSNLQEILTAEKDREAQTAQMKSVLAALRVDIQNAIAALGNLEEHKSTIMNIYVKLQEKKKINAQLVTNREEIQYELEEDIRPKLVAIERRITTIENIKHKRLEFLKNNHENTFRAVNWLRENRQLFNGHIYEPIILEINVKDPANTKYIENTISIRDLIAFTCERKDDMALFLRETRTKLKLAVNAVQSDATDRIKFAPRIKLNQLKKFGFHSYLIDLIEGPAPILNYLCQLSQIHNIPVGNDQTYDVASSVPDEIRLFFTSNHRFAVSISRYSNVKSTKSVEISTRRYLISIDHDSLKQQQEMKQTLVRKSDQLRNTRSKIESEILTVQEECNSLSAEKRAGDEKLQHLKILKEKITRQEQKVRRLTENIVNVAEEKLKSKNEISQIIGKMLAAASAYKDHLRINVSESHATQLYRLILRRYNNENKDIESEIRIINDEITNSKRLIEKIKSAMEQKEEILYKKKAEAKKLTNGLPPTHKNFRYKDNFSKLPNTLVELQVHMDDIQTRIDCMGMSNSGLQAEFENREKSIEKLRLQIANSKGNVEELATTILELYNQWYPEIQRIVVEINQNFSRFMGSMGYAGEVEICRGADERDYHDYGIQIRVKYRNNGHLQILDRQVQSGGERAVAIAVYTLSLQHLTHVPFRCVDEINQGMDPKNERKIFEMLVDETCKPGESQYFFVTPKLLPNFKDHDLMDVFVIYNGPFIADHHMFVMDKINSNENEDDDEDDGEDDM